MKKVEDHSMGEDEKYVVVSAEDDPDDRFLIREAVESIRPDLHLKFVKDGKELIDYLNRFRGKKNSDSFPSLILLDLNMPHMDGREALERIKRDESFKDLPVVVFTTSSEERDREVCSGANDFVSKPSSFTAIVAALDDIFAKWL